MQGERHTRAGGLRRQSKGEIEWEKERIVEAKEEAEENQDPDEKLKHIEHVTLHLEDDIRALTFQIVKE